MRIKCDNETKYDKTIKGNNKNIFNVFQMHRRKKHKQNGISKKCELILKSQCKRRNFVLCIKYKRENDAQNAKKKLENNITKCIKMMRNSIKNGAKT